MTLQIDKSKIRSIPADVEARILPKTLFGEKFVDLVVPQGGGSGPRLKPGDVIQQDRSQTAIELQTVFNDLVPLLRTLKPQELSVALSNLAGALRGRGDQLGQNLEYVNTYFSRFNRDLPNFEHDISALADLSNNYADAAPDLLAMLRNFSVNARTMTEKQQSFTQFLTASTDFAGEASDVFGENANRLITLANVSAPVTHLYSQYSKVLECLPNGLAIYDRTRLEQAFGQGPYLHITLTPVGDRGAYTAADRPRKSDLTSINVPPNCYGLPYGSHGLHPVFARFPGNHPSDNYKCGGYGGGCSPAPPAGAGTTARSGRRNAKASTTAVRPTSSSVVGSPSEQRLVATIGSADLGGAAPSPGLMDLLLGPMLRGMAVSVS
jgi:virulence factor Mce-like protein